MRSALDRFKIGDRVHCPADRGDAAYHGRVDHVDGQVVRSAGGVLYRWITVRREDGRPGAVWPSHRISPA